MALLPKGRRTRKRKKKKRVSENWALRFLPAKIDLHIIYYRFYIID